MTAPNLARRLRSVADGLELINKDLGYPSTHKWGATLLRQAAEGVDEFDAARDLRVKQLADEIGAVSGGDARWYRIYHEHVAEALVDSGWAKGRRQITVDERRAVEAAERKIRIEELAHALGPDAWDELSDDNKAYWRARASYLAGWDAE